MLTSHEYEKLFTLWKMEHGVERTSRRGTTYFTVPPNSHQRRQMLSVLIDTLIEKHGYTEEDFGSVTCNYIVDACVPEEYDNKESLRKWRKAAASDLMIVLALIFGKDEDMVNKNRDLNATRDKVNQEYTANEPDLPPPTVQKLDPLAESQKTGIALPSSVEDTEFMKLLEGQSDE